MVSSAKLLAGRRYSVLWVPARFALYIFFLLRLLPQLVLGSDGFVLSIFDATSLSYLHLGSALAGATQCVGVLLGLH